MRLLALVFLTVGVVVCLGTLACAEGTREYVLGLSASPTAYEEESLFVGGGGIGGVALVKVNEEPVAIHGEGGKVLKLNHWMHEGSNSVSIDGKFGSPLYVKLAVVTGGEDVTILDRRIVDPKKTPNRPIEVNVSDKLTSVKGTDSLSSVERERLVEEMTRYIAALRDDLARHDGRPVAERLNEKRLEWAPAAYKRPIDEVKRQIDSAAELFSDPMTSVKIPAGELQIEVGDHVVLLWRKQQESITPLLLLTRGGMKMSIPVLRLVREDGRWHVWD